MKTLQELKSFYKTSLLPELRVLEQERKGIVRKLVINFVTIWGLLAVFFCFCYYLKIQGPPVVILPIVICCFVWQKRHADLKAGFAPAFKSSIIDKIVNFADDSLEYSASAYIDESDFIRSHIFNIAHDVYAGDDYVSGKIGETEIEFSELYSAYKISMKGYTQWHVIFRGLFFIADFNKDFSGKTVILPDKAERFLGRLGRSLQSRNKRRGQLIKLEDTEFEKYFAVYGDDQVQARYILSTSLMRRIVEFKKNTKRDIYLSFIDSKIYLAISYTRDLFEPNLHKTLLDFKPIQEYFEDLQLVISIVNDLNLNNRIWAKQ